MTPDLRQLAASGRSRHRSTGEPRLHLGDEIAHAGAVRAGGLR